MSATTTVSPESLGAHHPTLTRLTVQILPSLDPGVVHVTLTVPLDPTRDAEKQALDAFGGDGSIEIQHRPRIDLGAERANLSRAIARAYRETKAGTAMRSDPIAPIDDDDLRAAFVDVAEQGRSIWRRLLQPHAQNISGFSRDDAAIARAALVSALERDHRISIKSPVSLFPWGFLFDDVAMNHNDLQTLDLRRFWGFRHEIEEELDCVARRVLLPAKPTIAAAVCSAEDAAGSHRATALACPETAWLGSTDELRESLVSFDRDCFYFFGHALQQEPPTPTTSVLKLDGADLTVDNVQAAGGPQFQKNPVLAFINGCQTTPLHTWSEHSFLGLLCLRSENRVCCLTTFAEVPSAFGREMSRLFWDGLLARKERVGLALLTARRTLLQTYNHPMGLLYNFFGKTETRLS